MSNLVILTLYVQNSILTLYVQNSILTLYVQNSILTLYVQNSILKLYVQNSILTLYVQNSILTLYVQNSILTLYVETVTVGLDTFPRCETRNRSQSLFSAHLSVPHTFATLNPQLWRDQTVSTEIYIYVSFWSNINPRFSWRPIHSKGPLFADTTYLQDQKYNNNYTKFNIDYDVTSLRYTTR
jgi:hypothetical protein